MAGGVMGGRYEAALPIPTAKSVKRSRPKRTTHRAGYPRGFSVSRLAITTASVRRLPQNLVWGAG